MAAQAKQLSLTRFQPFKSTWGTISLPHLRGHSLIFLSFMPPSLPPLLASFLFYSFLFSCLPSTHPASHLPSNAPSIHLSINPIFLSIHSVIHGLSGSWVLGLLSWVNTGPVLKVLIIWWRKWKFLQMFMKDMKRAVWDSKAEDD